jgi:hypothetical protein
MCLAACERWLRDNVNIFWSIHGDRTSLCPWKCAFRLGFLRGVSLWCAAMERKAIYRLARRALFVALTYAPFHGGRAKLLISLRFANLALHPVFSAALPYVLVEVDRSAALARCGDPPVSVERWTTWSHRWPFPGGRVAPVEPEPRLLAYPSVGQLLEYMPWLACNRATEGARSTSRTTPRLGEWS